MTSDTDRERSESRRRRALRYGLTLLIVLVGIGLLAGVLVSTVAPIRNEILAYTIRRVIKVAPGSLSVKSARWRALDSVAISGILWTTPEDTLLAADSLRISIMPLQLLRRDIQVSELSMLGVIADVEAIQSILTIGETPQDPKKAHGASSGFPRAGEIPALPSIAVDQFRLSVTRIRWTKNLMMSEIILGGSIDLLKGHAPDVTLNQCSAKQTDGKWRVDQGELQVDMRRGQAKGRILGQFGTQTIALALSSSQDNRIRIVLSGEEGVLDDNAWGVDLSIRVDRKGIMPETLDVDLVLHTPGIQDISAIPELAGFVQGLPPLEGIKISGKGTVKVGLKPETSLRIEIAPNSWIDGGRASLSYRNDTFQADTLSLAFSDMHIDAFGTLAPDSIWAQAEAHLRGTALLQRLRPEASWPDSLFADLKAVVTGSTKAPAVETDLLAALRFGSLTVDEVRVHYQLRPGEAASLELEVDAMGLMAQTCAELLLSDTLTVHMAPIYIVETGGDTVAKPPSKPEATIRVQRATSETEVSGVTLRGALGDATLGGRYSSSRAGSFRLSWSWPEPPRLLMSRLPLENHVRDSLAARWRRNEMFNIIADGTFTIKGDQRNLQAGGRFILPGPRVWGPLFLPPQAQIGDLGPVRGRFHIASRNEPAESSVAATLDLKETDWIEDGRIVVETNGTVTSIDTLSLRLDGLDLKAEGAIFADSLSLEAQLEAANEGLLRRALGDSTLNASVSVHANLSGAMKSPNVKVGFKGGGSYRRYAVPEISGDLSYQHGRVETQMTAGKGVDLDRIRLDKVTVRAASGADSLLPIQLTLMASGPDLEMFNVLRVHIRPDLAVDLDSLRWVVRGRDLTSLHPFRFGFDQASHTLSISQLDLRGGMGQVRADGFLAPDSSNLRVEIATLLPEKPPFLNLPADLWPQKLDMTLEAHGRNELHGDIEITGFHLADRRDLAARLILDAHEGAVRGSLSVGNASGILLSGKTALPMILSIHPFHSDFGAGDLFAELTLKNAPIPLEYLAAGAEEEKRIVKLDGRVVLGGTLGKPTGELTLRAAFPGWPRLSSYSLNASGELNGSAAADSNSWAHGFTGEPATMRMAMLSPLTSSVTFLKDNKEILTAKAGLPIRFSLHPYTFLIPEGRPMEASVNAEKLDLSDFNGLLPPDVEIGGNVGLQLTASGPANNPDLSGGLLARKFRVSTADGSRTVADATVKLSGTGRKPEIEGQIEILNGVIRIPEEKRALHPIDGEALLWGVEGLHPVSLEESSPGSPGKPKADGMSEPPKLLEMNLNVAVSIPSGLWIRGRGLDVELAGELNVAQKGRTLPTITGELSAVRGQLIFLGRTFSIDSGKVVFFGGDEIDPSIDLVLSARVGDAVITTLFSGTAQQPELAFSSDPEMTEGDIMAFLLFGRPLGELSSNQMDLLQSRAIDVAASYPLAKLEERLSRSLGVDMMSIRRAEGTDTQSTLIVGKYLTPRALLKYEQALDSATSFYINLEYMLSQHFKLQTLTGTQGTSGIEVGWSK